MSKILIEYGPTNDGRHLVIHAGMLWKECGKAGTAKTEAEELGAKIRAEQPGIEVKVQRVFFRSAEQPGAQAKRDAAGKLEAFLEQKVGEIATAITSGDYDEQLEALGKLEADRFRPRRGVMDALDERADDLLDAIDLAEIEAEAAEMQAAEAELRSLMDGFGEASLINVIGRGGLDVELGGIAQIEAGADTPRPLVLDAVAGRMLVITGREGWRKAAEPKPPKKPGPPAEKAGTDKSTRAWPKDAKRPTETKAGKKDKGAADGKA